MFRHSHRSKSFSHTTQLNNAETQTNEFISSGEEFDLTLNICSSIEESGNSHNTLSLFSSKIVPNVLEELTTPQDSCSFTQHPDSYQTPSSPNSPLCKNQFPIVPSSVQLQSSSRGLKDELQQGVEDVRHKFNQFFSKSSSVQVDSKQNPPQLTNRLAKTPDRPSFSLFNK